MVAIAAIEPVRALADAGRTVSATSLPALSPVQEIDKLSILVFVVCVVIFVIVAGLLVYTIVRFRHRADTDDTEPPQVYGSNEIELAWTVIPILLVIVFFLATARTISSIQNAKPTPDSLQVTIVGHQWWWEVRYPDLGIVTANEIHIPAGTDVERRPTFLRLESADVVHSFWVPGLNGKTDVIPNHVNTTWLDPRAPGIYRGQCAEFCGVQHANMLLQVVVETPEEFQKWVDSQKQPAVDTQPASVSNAFLSKSCVNCHTVRGTTAEGTFGPDLTHLMSRATIGSGVTTNTAANLRTWVHDPQTIKDGCYMPNMQLTDEELDQVSDYLASLK